MSERSDIQSGTPVHADELAPISPLVAGIVSSMFKQSAATSNYLVDSLTKQVADLVAELDAVRDTISGLYAGDYQPSGTAVLRALYPPDHVIDLYRKGES